MTNELTTVKETAVSPIDRLQFAIEKGVDVTQLGALMDAQERWEANEARKAYVAAVSSFREECPVIDRTKKAHNSKYAGLAETLEQIKPLLAKHGLSHSWRTDQADHGVSVTCCLTHIMGHQETTTLNAAPDNSGSKNSIQAIGSTVSYLQRYTLFAILGLASKDQDDDGKGIIERISDEEAETLTGLAHEVEADLDKFCNYMGVSCVREITTRDFGKAMNALNKKRAAA